MKIQLRFIERGDEADLQTSLQITNNSNEYLGHDWRLYFSLGLTPLAKETSVNQVLLDGRYGYLEPTSDWEPLAPTDSTEIAIEGWLFSGMHLIERQGFHLVRLVKGVEESIGIPEQLEPDLLPMNEPRLKWIQTTSPNTNLSNTDPEVSPLEFEFQAAHLIPEVKHLQPGNGAQSGKYSTNDQVPSCLSDLFEKFGLLSDSGTEIVCSIDPSLAAEAYRIEHNETALTIHAATQQGFFYATQTLRQILQLDELKTGLQIEDSPDFEHRCVFLDIARHFHDTRQLKKVIRALAAYKFNRLQLGISNDEAWRVEIPEIPELTEIGSKRSYQVRDGNETRALFPAWGDGPEDVSGHIKANDFVELLRFADEHHVEIILEFNLPGHANALLRSLDNSEEFQLTDPADESAYRSAQGYDRNVVNVAMPDCYRLATKVIQQFKNYYDQAGLILRRLHLGGDEVPVGAWLQSPACRSLDLWQPGWDIENPNDAKAATGALMSFHFQRITEAAQQVVPDIELGFWHEMAPHGDEHAYFNGWVTEKGDTSVIHELLKRNQRLVISNASYLYLDMPYALSADEPGLPWAGYINTDTIYHFDPLNCWEISDEHRQQVLGIQAQLWSETVYTSELMDYYLFPRLLAVAERAWNQAPKSQHWDIFYQQVAQRETAYLNDLGIQGRPLP